MLKLLAYLMIVPWLETKTKAEPLPAEERERINHGDPYDELTTRSFNTLMNSGGAFKQF
ncbi:MAG: hypothetical protein AB3N20_17420 [Rhizobiaceae bacterium]